jgi:LacI family transcriptional regulator
MGYVRLKEIAERASVSINTVSRALKDRPDISESTKEKIRQIANELGYIPNVSASRLRSKQNRMIGVVLTYLDNNFYARILEGINTAFSEKGYTILTLSSQEELENEQKLLKTLVANRVAGMIIVPSQDLVNTMDYDDLGVPHITIVRKGNRNTRSFFISDSYESGRLAAGYFRSRDCRSPAYIGFDKPVSCNRDRLSGFRESLNDAGILLKKERTLLSAATAKDAYEAAKMLFTTDRAVDAVFVYNDVMALGVLRAMHEHGIVPKKDMLLLGHDDIDNSRFYTPALSTIRVPKYRLGYDAGIELIGLMENSETPERNVIYRPQLVERET